MKKNPDSIVSLIKEFGDVLDTITRLRTQAFTLNKSLVEADPIQTLADYKRLKETFRLFKVTMVDLDREIERITADVSDHPPSYETGQMT